MNNEIVLPVVQTPFTDTYRAQIKLTEDSLEISILSLLNMFSQEQLDGTMNDMDGLKFTNPDTGYKMEVCQMDKIGDSWFLYFDDTDSGSYMEFDVKDLSLEDKLGILESIESQIKV